MQGKISTNCGEVTSRGLDDSEKSLATQLHNQLRAKLARGEEIRGHPGPQPSASNMMQMVSVWDDTEKQNTYYPNKGLNLIYPSSIFFNKVFMNSFGSVKDDPN